MSWLSEKYINLGFKPFGPWMCNVYSQLYDEFSCDVNFQSQSHAPGLKCLSWFNCNSRTFKKRTFLALACRGRFLYCWVLKWQISASRFLNHQSVLTWRVLTVYAKPSSCFSRASPRKQFKDFCLSRTNNQGLLKLTDLLFMTSNLKELRHSVHFFKSLV